METERFWVFRSAEAPVLLQKLSCVSVNVDHTERKRHNDFQGLSLASRILSFPRICNVAYDTALSFCLLLLKSTGVNFTSGLKKSPFLPPQVYLHVTASCDLQQLYCYLLFSAHLLLFTYGVLVFCQPAVLCLSPLLL